MRISVATLLLASVVAAHVPSGSGHDALAKRHAVRASRNLTARESNFNAEFEAFSKRFDGSHSLEDTPDVIPVDLSDVDINNRDLFGPATAEWERDFAQRASHLLRRQDANYTASTDGTDGGDAPAADEGTTSQLVPRWTSYESWMNKLDGGRSKVGIPWTNEVAKGWSKIAAVSKDIRGLYTWTEWIPVECAKYGIPCFPMLKNGKSDKINAFKSKIKWGAQGKASKYMMGPNECNLASQGNLTPAQAASVIKTYMYPLLSKSPNDGGYLLVGPSVANGASGQAWMDKFVKEQSAVWDKVAVQSIHCYSPDVNSIKAWMKLAHDRWAKPIFLTEYGCQSFTSSKTCTASEALAMAKELKAYCDANSWCRGVFPYSTFVTSRVGVNKVNAMFSNSNGDLTALGKSLLAV